MGMWRKSRKMKSTCFLLDVYAGFKKMTLEQNSTRSLGFAVDVNSAVWLRQGLECGFMNLFFQWNSLTTSVPVSAPHLGPNIKLDKVLALSESSCHLAEVPIIYSPQITWMRNCILPVFPGMFTVWRVDLSQRKSQQTNYKSKYVRAGTNPFTTHFLLTSQANSTYIFL